MDFSAPRGGSGGEGANREIVFRVCVCVACGACVRARARSIAETLSRHVFVTAAAALLLLLLRVPRHGEIGAFSLEFFKC